MPSFQRGGGSHALIFLSLRGRVVPGTPEGMCGDFKQDSQCHMDSHDESSDRVMHDECVGQQACTVPVSASTFSLKSCAPALHAHRLHVEVQSLPTPPLPPGPFCWPGG